MPRSYDLLLRIVRTHLEARRRMRNRENLERGHGHGLAGEGGESCGKGGGKKGKKGTSKSPSAGSRGICWQWQNT
eukprot:3514282-Karenia_brevis.AAC.1